MRIAKPNLIVHGLACAAAMIALTVDKPRVAASAGWTKVGTSELSELFVDPASVVRSKSGFKSLTLQNLKKTMVDEGTSRPVNSALSMDSYDCEKRTVRKISVSLLEGAMGAGPKGREEVYASAPEEVPTSEAMIQGVFAAHCR